MSNTLIILFQGWMNETHGYDPETFHPSVTHSVYVTLEGGQLRLAYPTTNIPRWAAFDDTPRHEAVFLRSRTYSLANCKVSTSPCASERSKREADLSPELSSLCTHVVI